MWCHKYHEVREIYELDVTSHTYISGCDITHLNLDVISHTYIFGCDITHLYNWIWHHTLIFQDVTSHTYIPGCDIIHLYIWMSKQLWCLTIAEICDEVRYDFIESGYVVTRITTFKTRYNVTEQTTLSWNWKWCKITTGICHKCI